MSVKFIPDARGLQLFHQELQRDKEIQRNNGKQIPHSLGLYDANHRRSDTQRWCFSFSREFKIFAFAQFQISLDGKKLRLIEGYLIIFMFQTIQ